MRLLIWPPLFCLPFPPSDSESPFTFMTIQTRRPPRQGAFQRPGSGTERRLFTARCYSDKPELLGCLVNTTESLAPPLSSKNTPSEHRARRTEGRRRRVQRIVLMSDFYITASASAPDVTAAAPAPNLPSVM